MTRFVQRQKMSKKARKKLDAEGRWTWSVLPITKTVDSQKLYNRKRKSHARYDTDGMGFVFCASGPLFLRQRACSAVSRVIRTVLTTKIASAR